MKHLPTKLPTFLFALVLAIPGLMLGQPGLPIVDVSDADIVGNTFWTSDNVYLLDGFVFVEEGETLTIEPGTVIKGKPGTGENASALIVARGGKIFAEGTPWAPIIFTAEADDVTDPGDLPTDARGLWGGLIILGSASLNSTPGETAIEGIPTTEPRGIYGGDDDDDDSGVLRFLSVRHGGSDIGAGNEINGVTFGGVGRGTVVDHIEVYNNADDGYEWFGGTVNTKYLVSAFNGDDSFDTDEGWRGTNQFWFAIQDDETANRGGEHDGGTDPEDGTPYSTPVVCNATYIGSGSDSPNADNDVAMIMRDNSGISYFNSIFTEYAGGGVNIEDLDSGEDSRARLEASDLQLQYNTWWNFGAGNNTAGVASQDFVQTYLDDPLNHNVILDPALASISRDPDGGLDPRPVYSASSHIFMPAYVNKSDCNETYHQGAFGVTNWAYGWTALSQLGYFGEQEAGSEITITDADINGDEIWTSNNTYILDGFVFVEEGESLSIEAGTVIKGSPGTGENASALIVARGGKIFAEGNKYAPVIFTAGADDVSDPGDLPRDARGLWGGVILLGRASLNSTPGETAIEGIPTTEPRGIYGGDDDEDSSGALCYVSVRHGGSDIGAGNEINGVTFGGVGSNTLVDHIEVYNNADDGYEWFGGTVNAKYLVSAFNGDDSFDTDEGWRGKGHHWFAIQDAETANRAGEHDGGTDPEDGTPFSTPVIYNATMIGSGVSSTNVDNDFVFAIRDNSGISYHNSIFTDFAADGLNVEDLDSGEDSRARLEAGDLNFVNNIWYGFGAGNTIEAIAPQEFVRAHLEANNNQIEDPLLANIDRDPAKLAAGELDPRPQAGSPAWVDASTPDDPFFPSTTYLGAFGDDLWIEGWTALSGLGFIGVAAEADAARELPTRYELGQNYPNPFNPSTSINFTLSETGHVRVAVYDLLGREVRVLVDGLQTPGTHVVNFDASDLPSGVYMYRMEAGQDVHARKMMLLK